LTPLLCSVGDSFAPLPLPTPSPVSLGACCSSCANPLIPNLLPHLIPISISLSSSFSSPLSLLPPSGEPGLREATGLAILNANYMAKRIEEVRTVYAILHRTIQHHTCVPCTSLPVHSQLGEESSLQSRMHDTPHPAVPTRALQQSR
jgi:hypothetical protein